MNACHFETFRKVRTAGQANLSILGALHRTLDMEGMEMPQLDQSARPLERSERVSLLLTPEERTQQILLLYKELFETETSGSYDGIQLQAQAEAS